MNLFVIGTFNIHGFVILEPAKSFFLSSRYKAGLWANTQEQGACWKTLCLSGGLKTGSVIFGWDIEWPCICVLEFTQEQGAYWKTLSLSRRSKGRQCGICSTGSGGPGGQGRRLPFQRKPLKSSKSSQKMKCFLWYKRLSYLTNGHLI